MKPPRLIIAAALSATLVWAGLARAAPEGAEIPPWLQDHVGTGEGKITAVVLERARALYQRKVEAGEVKNPCYMAKDVTRPSGTADGRANPRFYVICEEEKSYRAVSSGYGNGRKLKAADFSNGRQCAQNFSNAEGSKLTMGGPYVTAETKTSFKGYHRVAGKRTPFYRTFLQYEGEGETENAREREIGGHEARFLKWQCRFKKPQSPHSDEEGYVPFGELVNYTGGRSNGCTTWAPAESDEILEMMEGDPTTLYVYPESGDIDAVAEAVKAGRSLESAGLYWNAECLKAIGTPKFWPKSELQPVIDAWRDSLPEMAPYVLPKCK